MEKQVKEILTLAEALDTDTLFDLQKELENMWYIQATIEMKIAREFEETKNDAYMSAMGVPGY